MDSTVQNGQTYYYAVTAYDQGYFTTNISGTFVGIPPSETSSIIKLDLNGRVTKVDVNTAVVTPRAAAAGYIIPKSIAADAIRSGTGSVAATIIDLDSLRDSHNYRVEFVDSSAFHDNPNPYYRLIDLTTRDTVLSLSRLKGQQEVSPVLGGFNLVLKNDQYVTVNTQKTGWVKGSSNYVVQVGFDSRYANAYQTRRVNYPADFDITLSAKGQGDLSFPSTPFSAPAPSNIMIRNITESRDHIQFVFRDLKEDSLFDDGDALFIVSGDSAGKAAGEFTDAKFSWSVSFFKDTLIAEASQRPPQPGDVFRIVTTKPFRTGESFSFTTVAPAF